MSTVHPDAGVLWFAGLGFRPAVWTPPHRADGVDYPRIVPAPDSDVPFMAKYDALEAHIPASGYAWGTWIPAPQPVTPSAASLAGVVPGTPVTVTPWFPATPLIPGEPEPWFPCCIIETPTFPAPPMPAPVAVEAHSLLLLVSALAFVVVVKRRSLCRTQ